MDTCIYVCLVNKIYTYPFPLMLNGPLSQQVTRKVCCFSCSCLCSCSCLQTASTPVAPL